MSPTEPQPTVPKPERRWYRYGLWKLLLVLIVLVFVIPCVGVVVQIHQRRAIMKLAAPDSLNTLWCHFDDSLRNHRRFSVTLSPEECGDAQRLLLECLTYGHGPRYEPEDRIAGNAAIWFHKTGQQDALIGLEYCHGIVRSSTDDVGTLLVRVDAPNARLRIVNIVPVDAAMKARIDDIFAKAEQNPKAVRE